MSSWIRELSAKIKLIESKSKANVLIASKGKPGISKIQSICFIAHTNYFHELFSSDSPENDEINTESMQHVIS